MTWNGLDHRQTLYRRMKMLNDVKESSGVSRSRTTSSSLRPISLDGSPGSKDKLNWVLQDTNIGNSFAPSRSKSPSEASVIALDHITPNSPILEEPTIMFGRKRLLSQALASNSELNPSLATRGAIGSQSGWPRNPDDSSTFPQMYELRVTGSFATLHRIIRQLFLWYEGRWCTGVHQTLANPTMPGNKRAWMLTLKIHGPSFGMDTLIITTLSSMNFEEVLMLPTFSDGLTAIQSEWISKDPPSRSVRRRFGSRPISPLGSGIPTSTTIPTEPWKDDSTS